MVLNVSIATTLLLLSVPGLSFGQLGGLSEHNLAFSPPSYPSPWMSPTGEGADAYAKARDFVSQLTLLEKVNLTTGKGYISGRCLGETGSIPRLGFSGMSMQCTPLNQSHADFTSGFPSGLAKGATWDRRLMYSNGKAMGNEFRGLGADSVLEPACGALGRFPKGGRNVEAFSPDPYLCGEHIAPTIEGIQEAGVIATTRHFIANEQEHFRNSIDQAGFNLSGSISANLDDRTVHEVYLWPFANAVRAGTGAIMASYNQINNSYGGSNSYNLNHFLKGELGSIAAPIIAANPVDIRNVNISEYIFPEDIPQYPTVIYPYLNSTNLSVASRDRNYGRPSEEWLPPNATSRDPQPVHPAGGAPGGNALLWVPVCNISATVMNSGDKAGHEVMQLYLGLGRESPPRVLRGFERVFLEPGESKMVTMQLLRRDVSVWDVTSQNWVAAGDNGEKVKVWLGASSRDLRLEGDMVLLS